MIDVIHDLTVKPREAKYGTRKTIVRKNKRLEVTIPPGVKNGTLVKLSGALQITDGYSGDLFIRVRINNTNRIVYTISAFALIFIVISSILIALNITPSPDNYITVFNNKQPKDFSSYGKPIQLVNNNNAINPTWAELKAFLISDKTDEQPYIEYAYECASYAEEVHNHAEARGIKAAFVAVFFLNDNEGHALNAFQTTDKGLVYIDCQGYDTVAYIKEQEEYGLIEIKQADNFNYSYYIYYHDKVFEPVGIVETVEIYW